MGLRDILRKKTSELKLKKESISIGQERDSSGTGYITIPIDLERDVYIRGVFETGKVMIVTSQNQIIRDASLSLELLEKINFPSNQNQIGSLISWINVPKTNQVLVTGTYLKPDEFYLNNEEFIYVEDKSNDSFSIKIIKNLQKTGQYGISVTDKKGDDANILLKANSTSEGTGSEIKISSDGESYISSDKKTIIKSEGGVLIQLGSVEGEITTLTIDIQGNLSYQDKHGNHITIEENLIQIHSGEIKLGEEADQSLLLGNKTQTELNKSKIRIDAIIQAFSSAAVAPGDGGATFKAALILALSALNSENYSEILSSVSKTK